MIDTMAQFIIFYLFKVDETSNLASDHTFCGCGCRWKNKEKDGGSWQALPDCWQNISTKTANSASASLTEPETPRHRSWQAGPTPELRAAARLDFTLIAASGVYRLYSNPLTSNWQSVSVMIFCPVFL